MSKFSERIGLTKPKVGIQIQSIDDDLRNCTWNVIYQILIEPLWYPAYMDDELTDFFKLLWHELFKKRNDNIDKYNGKFVVSALRDYYFQAGWFQVYDLLEFCANKFPDEDMKDKFVTECNKVFERELSGYRFIGSYISQITSSDEIKTIEDALASPIKTVGNHISSALKLLSDKQNPDFRNSIKESISAVEAICKLIAKNEKTDLTGALAIIESQGKISLHPALRRAFLNLYGYTCDADGIRHAFKDDKVNSDFDEAKFMLVSCSAFVNYLLSKAAKAGLQLI
jgi:hypothetical protein